MIKYEVLSVQDRIIDGKVYGIVFIKIESDEIKSTSFTIEVELDGGSYSKAFIENKIKEKVEFIKAVEQIKEFKTSELEILKKSFVALKGTI